MSDEKIKKAMTQEQAHDFAFRLNESGTRRSVWWRFWAEQIEGTPFYKVVARNNVTNGKKEFFEYTEGRIVDEDWGLGSRKYTRQVVGTRPAIFYLAHKVVSLENEIAELKKTLAEITSALQRATDSCADKIRERARDE